MSEEDLNDDFKTTLTLEAGDETVSIAIEGTALSVTDFMELIEMLLVKAKYNQKDIDDYVLQWAKDIKFSKNN